jgi:hypothetical protein
MLRAAWAFFSANTILGSVGFAGLYALAAGLGALLAVVVLVLTALIGALLANFDALFDNVLGVGRIARNEGRGEAADVGTIAVGANTGHHHFDIFLVEAGIGAVFAGGNATT